MLSLHITILVHNPIVASSRLECFNFFLPQKRVPHFKTMFSDLRHYPRYGIHLEVTDPVPKFIPRQWRGYAEQDRDALIRYTT